MDRTLNEKLDIFFDDARTRRALFWLILAIGIFARVFRFGLVPDGINQDEAFAGYEAWALLNYGIDTAGYHNPVYLTAWGSGMNALESYLMMPFIALFGLKVWVIRLPQLIVSCMSLWVAYLLVRRTVNERAGLTAMFMLVICPWHIIMSRWGLESNLAPGFLLFGLYFFVRALDAAMEKADTVYIDQNEFYTKVLFYAEEPVDEFRSTVEYLYYPTSYLHALSFDKFRFWVNPYFPEDGAAYVMPAGSDYGKLLECGFTVEYYGNYAVAYKEAAQ